MADQEDASIFSLRLFPVNGGSQLLYNGEAEAGWSACWSPYCWHGMPPPPHLEETSGSLYLARCTVIHSDIVLRMALSAYPST